MSFRDWFGRFARSKGLTIFLYVWAIVTLIMIGLTLYGPPNTDARKAASKNAPAVSEPPASQATDTGAR